MLAGVEFTELYPDEVPLLADEEGEFQGSCFIIARRCSGRHRGRTADPPVDPQVSQSEIEGTIILLHLWSNICQWLFVFTCRRAVRRLTE